MMYMLVLKRQTFEECVKGEEKVLFMCPAHEVKCILSGMHRTFINYRNSVGLHKLEFNRPDTYVVFREWNTEKGDK